MALDDYESILDASWDEIPTDKLLPVGSYRLRGQNLSIMKARSADQNDVFLFVYTVREALDDVDQDELEALGDYDLESKKIFQKFWVDTGADFDAVRKHLKKHGIDTTGRSIKETAEAFKGTEVIAYLGVKTYENKVGDTVQDNEPSQFAPVDD